MRLGFDKEDNWDEHHNRTRESESHKRVLRTVILIILGALLGMLLGVLVVQIAFAATGRSAGNTNVTIAGFAYSPNQAVVRVGDTVTWNNNDSAPHTVTANDASLDSGTLGQGGRIARGVFAHVRRDGGV